MNSSRLLLAKLAEKYRSRPSENDLSAYADNPVEFALDVLGLEFLTDDQRQILGSVRDNPEVNCPSAHGMGKTLVAAVCSLWWVFAVKGLVITSAPTLRQVKELLWSEIRRLYDRNSVKLGGERGQMYVKLSEEARGYGFSSSDYDVNAFQGVHHARLLIILDEACGISPPVEDGAISCLTGANNRILRVGNPVQPDCPFEEACRRSSIRLPAWSHPNISWAYRQDTDGVHRLKPDVARAITAEDGSILPQSVWPDWCPRDLIPGAISIQWIENARLRKGEGSSFWLSRVEAYFPRDNPCSIIPRSWFLAARQRYDDNPKHWDSQASQQPWRHGLDVGDGGDSHALASWRGCVLYRCEAIPTKNDRQDVTRAAGLGKRRLEEGPGLLAVDRIGVGSGALAILLEQRLSAVGVAWGGSARDTAQFVNLKAEQFWLLREAFRTGQVAVAPLGEAEDEVTEDFASIGYDEISTGKIRIEEKSRVRKSLGRSPNCADAVVMAYSAKSVVKHSPMNTISYRNLG